MQHQARRWLRRATFAVVVAASVVILFAPGSDVPAAPAGTDKLVHGGLFAALLITGWWAGARPRILAPALIAYAAGSEWLQTIPALHRDGSLTDLLADTVGLVVGVAGALVARTRGRREEHEVAGKGEITRSARRPWR